MLPGIFKASDIFLAFLRLEPLIPPTPQNPFASFCDSWVSLLAPRSWHFTCHATAARYYETLHMPDDEPVAENPVDWGFDKSCSQMCICPQPSRKSRLRVDFISQLGADTSSHTLQPLRQSCAKVHANKEVAAELHLRRASRPYSPGPLQTISGLSGLFVWGGDLKVI